MNRNKRSTSCLEESFLNRGKCFAQEKDPKEIYFKEYPKQNDLLKLFNLQNNSKSYLMKDDFSKNICSESAVLNQNIISPEINFNFEKHDKKLSFFGSNKCSGQRILLEDLKKLCFKRKMKTIRKVINKNMKIRKRVKNLRKKIPNQLINYVEERTNGNENNLFIHRNVSRENFVYLSPKVNKNKPKTFPPKLKRKNNMKNTKNLNKIDWKLFNIQESHLAKKILTNNKEVFEMKDHMNYIHHNNDYKHYGLKMNAYNKIQNMDIIAEDQNDKYPKYLIANKNKEFAQYQGKGVKSNFPFRTLRKTSSSSFERDDYKFEQLISKNVGQTKCTRGYSSTHENMNFLDNRFHKSYHKSSVDSLKKLSEQLSSTKITQDLKFN